MDRDQLDKRNTAAVTHWWTTMRDSGRVEPGLLADLADIAGEHARQHALSIEESRRGEHVPARREEQAEAATVPVVAAKVTTGTASTSLGAPGAPPVPYIPADAEGNANGDTGTLPSSTAEIIPAAPKTVVRQQPARRRGQR